MKAIHLVSLASATLLTLNSCVHQQTLPIDKPTFPPSAMANPSKTATYPEQAKHPQKQAEQAKHPQKQAEQTKHPQKQAEQAKHPQKQAEQTSHSQAELPAGQQELLATLPLGIIGGTERVFLENLPTPSLAKVDTGADTCSLHAEEITYFERDGKPWVRFLFRDDNTGMKHRFERKLKRRPRIKRHGAESLRRPVVDMKIKLGSHVMKCEFTLTDRSSFKYPVLIGQNLLKGRAAVDVSRNFIMGK